MAVGIAVGTAYAASKIPIAIGATKLVGKKLLVWTGKKWAQRIAAKQLAKQGLKIATTKGTKAVTSARQRLAISRALGGLDPSKLSAQQALVKSGVRSYAPKSLQRTKHINDMLRKTYGSGKGFAQKTRLRQLLSLTGPAYLGTQAIGAAGNVFNPKDTSPLVEKKVKKLDEQEQLQKARVEAQVAATKAQVQQTVPEVGVTPGGVPSVAPVATDTETVPKETTTATPNKKKLSTKKPVKKTFKDVWGKDPSSIQKKLLAGGWTAEELYAKKLAHQQWKKNRGR